MADESFVKPISAEAGRMWEEQLEKFKKWIPSIKPASLSISSAGSVNKQQPQVTHVVAPVTVAPAVSVITRRPVPVEKPAVAPVQQTETASHQPKEEFSMVKDPWIRMLAFLVIGLAAMSAIDWHRDWSADKRNNRDIADARSEKDVAEIKASTPSEVKKVAPIAPAIVSTERVFNCSSPQSIQAGFRQKVIQSLSEVTGTPFVGCMLVSIGSYGDKPITLSGINYEVQLPVDSQSSSYDDSLKYFVCKDSSCTDFFQEARSRPTYQNKAVRILTTKDGHVIINQID